MAQSIKLSTEILEQAKRYSSIYNRSVPKQIEFWAKIGRIAEENPDLSYNFIKSILLAKSESETEELSEYTFE